MHRTIYEYISDSPYDVRVARTHPDVTVHDQAHAEEAIEDGMLRRQGGWKVGWRGVNWGEGERGDVKEGR